MKNAAACVVVSVAMAVGGWFSASAAEWTFPAGTDPARVEKADAALAFPEGFKATCRFSVDLAKVNSRTRFANLFCRGNDFHDGYCAMVRYDGCLLIDILGYEPQYYIVDARIASGREYTLELYVTPKVLRVFLDGREIGGFAYAEPVKTEYARPNRPLKIGTMGGYGFSGSLPYLKLESVSSVTMPPGGPKPNPTAAPKVQARAEIKWTKTICAEKDRYIGWPTVCRLKNGDLLAVFSGDRDEHVCPWGKVQMVRSTDCGETWSAPVTIANGILDDRDAGILQMPDGEVIVTWFTSTYWTTCIRSHRDWQRHLEKIPPEAIKAATGDFLIRSRDNGRTWSKPERLSVYTQTPHGPIVLKDGSLLEIGRTSRNAKNAASANSFSQTVITVAKSTDAGRTWQLLCPEIPSQNGENEKPSQFHEPHVCELADGTLVGMVRYHGPDNCMRVTRSRDGGRTWTPMEKTPMVGLPPHLLVLPDGKIVCVYGRRIADRGYGEFACISDDGGKTWDVANEIMLEPSFCDDLGYPASCLLPDGDILTVYYQKPAPREKAVLRATRWRVRK